MFWAITLLVVVVIASIVVTFLKHIAMLSKKEVEVWLVRRGDAVRGELKELIEAELDTVTRKIALLQLIQIILVGVSILCFWGTGLLLMCNT